MARITSAANPMRSLLFGIIALVLPVAASAQAAAAASAPADPFEALQAQRLTDAAQLIQAHQPADAITVDLDPVIRAYEDRYRNSTDVLYCGRWPAETLTYLLEATKEGKSATVLQPVWCDAYYLKAYALIDLHRVAEARQPLDRAIAMGPRNSQFLSERGQLEMGERRWSDAVATFEAAANAAEQLAPPQTKDAELARAWRGLGYAYVELGRLDEAERMYQRCLDLNPADGKATAEQQYVKSLIAKRAGAGAASASTPTP